MNELIELIKEINERNRINIVLERNVNTDGKSKKTTYRLKVRERTNFFIKKVRFLNIIKDEYFTNRLGNVINFRDVPQIIDYLRIQYSGSEGFTEMTEDIESVKEIKN